MNLPSAIRNVGVGRRAGSIRREGRTTERDCTPVVETVKLSRAARQDSGRGGFGGADLQTGYVRGRFDCRFFGSGGWVERLGMEPDCEVEPLGPLA